MHPVCALSTFNFSWPMYRITPYHIHFLWTSSIFYKHAHRMFYIANIELQRPTQKNTSLTSSFFLLHHPQLMATKRTRHGALAAAFVPLYFKQPVAQIFQNGTFASTASGLTLAFGAPSTDTNKLANSGNTCGKSTKETCNC